MTGQISVEQALKRGDWIIKYPLRALLFIVVFTSSILLERKLLPQSDIITGIITALFLYLLYKSIITTKWRIWACEHVNNIQELQSAALAEKFIHAENSLFSKLEIRSAKDKARLAAINEQALTPQIYTDDMQVPAKTEIYKTTKVYNFYNGLELMLAAVLQMGFDWGTIILLLIYFTPILISVGIPTYLIDQLKQRKNKTRRPILVISNEGIQTIYSRFIPWGDIKNEMITKTGSRNSSDYILKFESPDGIISSDISILKIKKRYLAHLLNVYRQRYLHNKEAESTTKVEHLYTANFMVPLLSAEAG